MQFMYRSFKWAVVAALVAGLAACATKEPILKATAAVAKETQRTEQVFSKVEDARKEAIPLYRRVSGLWISDRFVSSNSMQELPEAFAKTFVLRERKPLTISDVAEVIRARTGLNVILQGELIGANTFHVDHVGSVKSLVESVTSRQGMTWEWRDNTLLIQQSQIQTFVVNRSGLGALKAASGGTGAAAGASNRIDPWKDLTDAIKVISPNARVSILRASNAITVASKPADMKRIGDLIEMDSDNADKQVMIHWQLVNVTSRTGGEAGLNLNYIMARSGGRFSFASAASLASPNASVIKLDRTSGATNGSSAALTLLNESGVASVVAENIEPVKHNTTRKFGTEKSITYRAESTPGVASASTTSGSVGIKQATVEVGLAGQFGASIYDNESMDLMFDFSLKVLDALREDSSSGYVLQSPETTRRYAIGEEGIRIKHGNTYIISAEQTKDISFDRRGLLPGEAAVVGGSERSMEKKGLWLLLVTPVITQKGV
jgi:predicted small lipoprotein YifL